MFGINASNGEYIAFLDDDDEWLPEKLEEQIKYIENNSQIDGCTCLYSIKKENQIIRTCKDYYEENLQFNVFMRNVAVYTSTFMGKKETIMKSGAFNPNLLRHQDLQFFIDFLNFGKIHPINKCMVYIHADSTINRPNTDKLINVKREFFKYMKENLVKFSKKEQKRIKNAHRFEVIFSALKEKKIIIAIKYLFKIGLSISAYKDLYKRYKSR